MKSDEEEYIDLRERFGPYKSMRADLRVNKKFYTRITNRAKADIASKLLEALQAPGIVNLYLCRKLLDELEMILEILTELEKLS